jgi:hypothetical protein
LVRQLAAAIREEAQQRSIANEPFSEQATQLNQISRDVPLSIIHPGSATMCSVRA